MAIAIRISQSQIDAALNTPGGGVYDWVNEVAARTLLQAEATAPVNSILNALHRGGDVGEFKRSFTFDNRGSGGRAHRVMARVINTSDHAIYAELGRSGSTKTQVFTWENWLPNVGPRKVHATHGRDGSHTLANALDLVYAQMT